MKQTVTIEVDVPDGFEAIGVGQVLAGETFISILRGGEVMTAEVNQPPDAYRVKLRKIWQPPAWLKPGWIAMDGNGDWFWNLNEPFQTDKFKQWRSSGPCCCLTALSFVDFTPPPCTDWRTSLRQIGGGT